ncbi:metallophosphoesterase family protein [Evansella clarkii]|uniref:metallophosphoesterase family protein n=1 Tax=Evansella clarkii TaxID=79879 RepID=UPI000998E26F|nr:metallophosphoesterase [Evansella clarkii]
MKALIMSDTHGWTSQVKEIVERHQDEVDVILHCGDSELRADDENLAGLYTVRGNCDFGNDFPEEMVKEAKGYRFYVSHGHLLNVKMSEMNLVYKGEENEAHFVCFGHTHVPVAVEREGRILINPGSVRLPRQVSVGTYVILEAEENRKQVTFYSLDGEKQENLSKTFS